MTSGTLVSYGDSGWDNRQLPWIEEVATYSSFKKDNGDISLNYTGKSFGGFGVDYALYTTERLAKFNNDGTPDGSTKTIGEYMWWSDEYTGKMELIFGINDMHPISLERISSANRRGLMAMERVSKRIYKNDDSITGGEGDDVIMGYRGDDFIDDKRGSDLINGGGGNDTLSPDVSRGIDTLVGGDGKDVFAPRKPNKFGRRGYAILEDFNHKKDTILVDLDSLEVIDRGEDAVLQYHDIDFVVIKGYAGMIDLNNMATFGIGNAGLPALPPSL